MSCRDERVYVATKSMLVATKEIIFVATNTCHDEIILAHDKGGASNIFYRHRGYTGRMLYEVRGKGECQNAGGGGGVGGWGWGSTLAVPDSCGQQEAVL